MIALTRAKRAFLLAVVLLMGISATQARTITVDDDRTAEFTTIKAAVDAAEDGDVIVVGEGTYRGAGAADILLSGKAVTVRSTDPDDPAVVSNTVVDLRIDDGERHRFFELGPGKDSQLTLVGLTVTRSEAFSGGVVLCQGAIFSAINCTFTGNAVEWWGGAFYCEDSQATFQNCTFSHNTSAALRGGAVSCKNSTLVFANCLFEENTGNALTAFDSTATFSDCTFEGNTGSEGGAIYSYAAIDSGTSDHLTLTRCTFIGNAANSAGGVIHSYGADAVISSCTFTNNTSLKDGGAIYNHRCSASIENSLFSGNHASADGGAVTDFYDGRTQITNCTFVGNGAARGGAVVSKRQSHPVISQCIFWQNDAPVGSSVYVLEDIVAGSGLSQVTIEYSDIEFGQRGVTVELGSLLTWGEGNIEADPLFTDLAYGDYHLSSGSPCIDAGDPRYVPDGDATDLDGLPRLDGTAVDMGAYESYGLGPVYGFTSRTSNKQFFTMSPGERDQLIQEESAIWRFEGIVFYAFHDDSDPQAMPLYRFWSEQLGSYLWTTKEKEKDKLINNPSFNKAWTYEGVSFYVYPPGKQPLGTTPMYRFWSGPLGYHYYTTDENEKDELVRQPETWFYEGISWYVYPTSYQLETMTFDFSGGRDQALYTMTLKAFVDGKEAPIDIPDVDFTASVTHMRMTTDFTNLTATMTEFDVRSGSVSHDAVIKVGSLRIPFVVSAKATFEAPTVRGPFTIDGPTGTFADFVDAPQTRDAREDTFACNGTVQFGDQSVTFQYTASAVDLELSSLGTFESMDLLPEGLIANMPLTFQWYRPDLKDLLIETSVDGRRVQLYVTQMYVGTQGLWRGAAVR